ncbi:hypothetical protein E9564_07690 [Blastococcus sp. MG754427]|uniref:PfkB family carbohydrate kinase n=2 Tax=unclassified Blastococcus TaxID=2619396 RepID=UPI001F2B7E0A|nr:PfkB family carbohydrate kinase [Blastococcus sp. MG754427]MCF6511670.1 hypothetical protein [Blastococcus sp. MG754427]
MKIVGGTYAERVTVPAHEDDASGSGMRAAGALGPGTAELVTAIDAATAEVAEVAAATRGIERTMIDRDEKVGFNYFTPVSDPSVDGPGATHAPLVAEDETVLVFGMVEHGPRRVRAQRLVVDPQRPRDLTGLNLEGLTGDRLGVVANARETSALAGGILDPARAAQQVLTRSGAEVVVVKEAGRGCLVVTEGAEPVRVGPHPTRTVWPLGSGDVFAAGFTHAWDSGADPVEAARVASNAAAWWCGTRRDRVPPEILAGVPVETLLPGAGGELPVLERPPLIYLAAPFFTLAERWLVETCRAVLQGLGARVFSPLHDVGPGGDEVAAGDLDGLRDSDAVLALLDGWDPGTVYEVGWAHRHTLPVVGFLNGPAHEGTKMLVGTGAELHSDLSSALYRGVWAGLGHPLTAERVRPA